MNINVSLYKKIGKIERICSIVFFIITLILGIYLVVISNPYLDLGLLEDFEAFGAWVLGILLIYISIICGIFLFFSNRNREDDKVAYNGLSFTFLLIACPYLYCTINMLLDKVLILDVIYIIFYSFLICSIISCLIVVVLKIISIFSKFD